MALLTLQRISRSGLTPSFVAAAGGGDTFQNDGKLTFFYVKNGGGGSINATFVTQRAIRGLAIADLVVAVGAGSEEVVGPFPSSDYNDTSNLVTVNYSGVTTVTVAAFKIG